MLHVYIKFHPNLYKTLGNILVKYKHAEKNKKKMAKTLMSLIDAGQFHTTLTLTVYLTLIDTGGHS